MSAPEAPRAIDGGDEPPGTSRTVLGLIRSLQSGEVSGVALPAADRRRVVEHLWGEGYSVPETAEIVRASERTVLRDRAALKQVNAVRPDEGFVPETVGELLRQADLTVARLRRIARDKHTSASAKVDAELGCWSVTKDLVGTLQTLGYLPTAPRQFQGELTHRVEEAPSYEDLQAELDRVQGIVASGGDTEILDRVGKIRDTVTRMALGDQIRALAPTSSTGEPTDDHALGP